MADNSAPHGRAAGRAARLALLLAMLLSACSAPQPLPSPSLPPSPGGTSASASPSGVPAVAPTLSVSTVAVDLDHPWGLAMLPDGSMLVTERPGRLSVLRPSGQLDEVQVDLDVAVRGEGGLLDVAVSPHFGTDRTAWVCFNSGQGDVRVVPLVLASDLTSAELRQPLVQGMPANPSGRHSGCRLLVGADGMLWIGTGDAAQPRNPQDLGSLGGKVLRVDPDTGQAPADNPFAASPDAAQRLVYSYGHRNVQGLATQPGTGRVWSVEHGSTVDDELNLLVAGANYGWNPASASTSRYDESGVPMTDTRLPGARAAVWSSGAPTIATSGGTFLAGARWGSWQGRMVLAALRGQRAVLIEVNADDELVSQQRIAELDGYGRLRTVLLAPDGALYVTTDNGGDDVILRVTAN